MTGDLSWLPDRHLPVAATLAHADTLIERVGDQVLRYLAQEGGPIELTETRDGAVSRVSISEVRPIPRVIPLIVADVLTTLRAAIEHTLFAEVEHAVGAISMSPVQARTVEMPAAETAETFDKWVRDRHKRAPAPLLLGSPLISRIRSLQPYHLRGKPSGHPMKVLAEHSNIAKHRTPAVSAVRNMHSYTDVVAEGIILGPLSSEPAQVGDVLATTRHGLQTELTYFPAVSLRRPHTGEWPVLIHELDWLAGWTRSVAVPTLITGSADVAPPPARYDIEVGHRDERAAISAGSMTSALEILDRRRDSAIVRQDLPEILAEHPDRPSIDDLRAWIATLSDDEVLEKMASLKPARTVEAMFRTAGVVGELIKEMRQHQADLTPPAEPEDP